LPRICPSDRTGAGLNHHFDGVIALMPTDDKPLDASQFKKLGSFYLGREVDLEDPDAAGPLLMYEARDLTTHAVAVGMTGSGKTGLCLSVLEEAAIDGIPAIAIDPKGDLGNLLLTFPDLAPSDFRPWIDEAKAARQGVTPEELAKREAAKWKKGLASWGQDGARATTAMRGAGRASRKRDDIRRAEESVDALQGQRIEIEEKFAREAEALRDRFDVDGLEVETVGVAPRKADITIHRLVLAWLPGVVGA